ncbi:MAG: hypothetical protein A2029_07225 [Chloroflexi bacterium RBG_19FT_COMBO_47_9]|nr:MAG: hypothetical protein A2029_07225 [Chloroflexi bacterium RBG_19FT_COMBO_47_9]
MSTTIQFASSHYLFIGIVCLICFAIGVRITVHFNYHSFLERFTISTSLGMGLLALIIYFLGLLKGLYGRILIPVVLIVLIVVIVTWPGLSKIKIYVNGWRANFRKIKGNTAVWIAIIAVIFLVTYTLPLYPPIIWDSTEYHLAAAKIYTQSHALVFTPYLRYPVAPQLNQMLFVGAFVVYDEIGAHLTVFAMFILIACGLYAFSRRYFSPWVGILSSALWLGSPLSVLYGTIGYIDIGLTLFSLLGIYSFMNYYQTDENNWLWLSGIFLGFAAAVKYPALLYVLVTGLLSLWVAFKKRDFLIPVKLGIAIIAIAAPFYIRDYYYSGNPFFPYLSNIFHQRIWNEADVVSLTGAQSHYGLPKTVLSLVTLPWYLIFKPSIFVSGLGDKLLFSPVYFLAFPSLPLMFLIRKTRLLSIFTVSFTLFWFGTPQAVRYLLPAIPLLAITSSIAVDYLVHLVQGLVSRWGLAYTVARVLQPLVFTVLAFVVLLPSISYGQEQRKTFGKIPVSSSERAAFLQRFLPSFSAYRTLNGKLGDHYSIYALKDENMAYFANGTFMGDWFGLARFSLVMDNFDDDFLLYKQLRQLGADYFLINIKRMGQVPDVLFASPYFLAVDQRDTYIVYKLVTSP